MMKITIILKRSEGLGKIKEDHTCDAVSTWLVHREPLINSSYYPDSHSTNEDPEIQRGEMISSSSQCQ